MAFLSGGKVFHEDTKRARRRCSQDGWTQCDWPCCRLSTSEGGCADSELPRSYGTAQSERVAFPRGGVSLVVVERILIRLNGMNSVLRMRLAGRLRRADTYTSVYTIGSRWAIGVFGRAQVFGVHAEARREKRVPRRTPRTRRSCSRRRSVCFAPFVVKCAARMPKACHSIAQRQAQRRPGYADDGIALRPEVDLVGS
jgi:hypothetical protein